MTKAAFDRLRVDVWVNGTADRNGNGGYCALMYSMVQNQPIKRTIGGYGTSTTVTRMTLKAIVEVLKCLKQKVIIHFYVNLPQVSSGLNKNMYVWKQNDWFRKNNLPLKHQDLWKEIFDLLREKTISYKVHYKKDSPNGDNNLEAIHRSSQYLMQAKKELNEVAF